MPDYDAKTIQLPSMIFEKRAAYGEADEDSVPKLEKVEEEASDIRKQAKEEARQIHREMEEERRKAEEEIRQARDQAKEQGHKEGYQHGLQEGENQYQERINEARTTIDFTREARQQRLEESEADLLELSVNIAGKIVGRTIANDENRWLEVVKDAILEVKEYEQIRLSVHHKWYEFVAGHQKELESLLKKSAELYIYPQATDDEFSCMIEYPHGRIDASVDSRLREIKQKLADILGEADK